jgi:hypothetical protein
VEHKSGVIRTTASQRVARLAVVVCGSVLVVCACLWGIDERFGRVFASLHERLNDHFVAINDRARSTRHYWADNSRALIALIDELTETIGALRRVGFDVSFREDYDVAVRRCKPWLSTGGGSAVPEDFEPIEIVRYEPVFIRSETTVKLKKQSVALKLQLIREGSYAHVFSFVDPDYGIKIAVKRAKKGLDEHNLLWFREEFNILKRLMLSIHRRGLPVR